MEIHLLLSGEQVGPFSETQIRQYLGEGLVSTSDLAIHEGMENWKPLDLVLAHLTPSASATETISPNEPPPESTDPADQTPEPDTPFIMHNDAFELIEPAPALPPVEPVPPLTASQKTKRKLNKIVIQPILPLEPTAPIKKKSRTGKPALTLEPLRPTTSLPPVAAHLPREKKAAKPLIQTGRVSLGNFADKAAVTPTAPPPPAPLLPPAHPDANGASPPPLPPPVLLPTKSAKSPPTSKARFRRIPRGIIYACAATAVLLVCIIFFWIYRSFASDGTSSALDSNQPDNAPPPPIQLTIQGQETVPKTAADFSDRGLARQTKGDLDAAILDYNQALALDPKNVEAFYRRALARQAKGDMAGALADYTQVLGLDPKRANAFSNRGFIKQAQGDFDGALADYNQALLINPKIPRAYYNVGLIDVQKGSLDEAIAAYDHALELDPTMAFAYYNRGVAKNTEGNLDGAIADFTQALVLNPNIASAYCDRGFARQSKGDSDGALADYSQALALNPKMANAFYNRGLIKMQKGDLDGAVDDDSRAIDLDPKNGQAFYKRGLAQLGKGSLDGALADLKNFCELAPTDSGTDVARLYIWLISTEQNPNGDADAALSTSLLNDWNSPPEDLTSKIAAFLLGHINENDLIANAASPDPSREPGQYCRVWYFAGMKRLLSGDMTTGISYFQKSLATNQKNFCEYIFAQAELQALGQNHEVAAKPVANP